MTTDIAVIDQTKIDEFINSAGLSAEDLSGGSDYLPQLKINYSDESETGKELKKGVFFLTGQDITVYAKNVTIRPLLHLFQWTDYSEAEKATVNRTKFIASFKEEAIDEKGTVRCGKPPSKDLKNNPALAEMWDHVKCYRTLHVLVSYVGQDEDGNTHEVNDVLATMRLKGVNFTPFKEEFIDSMPKNSNLWDYEITLGTTKEKNDPKSANSFYVIHFDADFTKRLPVTEDVYNLAKEAQSRINDFNSDIELKYYKAVHNRTSSDRAIDALDEALEYAGGSSLEDDLVS